MIQNITIISRFYTTASYFFVLNHSVLLSNSFLWTLELLWLLAIPRSKIIETLRFFTSCDIYWGKSKYMCINKLFVLIIIFKFLISYMKNMIMLYIYIVLVLQFYIIFITDLLSIFYLQIHLRNIKKRKLISIIIISNEIHSYY